MVCSTILLGLVGKEFVTLGCKEFLLHSNPLSFLKGVERVTARPPPLHENCTHIEGGPIE